MFNFIGRRKELFLILCAVFTFSFFAVNCGGGGGSGGGPANNTQTPLTGALFPEEVDAAVTGDISSCVTSDDSCTQLSACLSTCYADYSLLDPNDPDSIENLDDTFNKCTDTCYTQNSDCVLASTFMISLTLTNTSTETKTITLPPGVIFVPGDSEYQQMMIIEKIVIVIQSKETKSVCLPVYCIDLSLHSPDDAAVYTSYRFVDPADGCLSEIMTTLGNVDFTDLTHSNFSEIQDVIWTCREEGSIDQDEQSFLDSLPKIATASLSATGSTDIKKLKKRSGFWKSQLGY
jgi:hypothetical protein